MVCSFLAFQCPYKIASILTNCCQCVSPRDVFLANELLIYCDESVVGGEYFSNFYGGGLVSSRLLEKITTNLNAKKKDLNFHGEVKWSKITENYVEKYIDLLDEFFGHVENNELKIRIMFRQNFHVAEGLTQYHIENSYFLLYYQFIKHAFGLKYYQPNQAKTKVKLYFDNLPDTKEKTAQFKAYLLQGLSTNKELRQLGLQFNMEDIVEVNSHEHVILQCVDIVLGAMQFRLNNLHKSKPAGQKRRGKRTIAKEKVYKHILNKIKAIHSPHFNISISTGVGDDIAVTWEHPYRHWLFKPNNHTEDHSKTKKSKKVKE